MKYSILNVSPIVLIEFCKNGTDAVRVVNNAVPADAKYIRSYTNDTTGWGMISLVLESESFPDLHEGDLIPLLPNPEFEKLR